MLKVLTDNLPPPSMFHAHFNKRLISYMPKANGVILLFADGTTAEADMLIGADGIKSATRATMYTRLANRADSEEGRRRLLGHIRASWSGTYAYRALVDTKKLLSVFPNHQAASTPMIVRLNLC